MKKMMKKVICGVRVIMVKGARKIKETFFDSRECGCCQYCELKVNSIRTDCSCYHPYGSDCVHTIEKPLFVKREV